MSLTNCLVLYVIVLALSSNSRRCFIRHGPKYFGSFSCFCTDWWNQNFVFGVNNMIAWQAVNHLSIPSSMLARVRRSHASPSVVIDGSKFNAGAKYSCCVRHPVYTLSGNITAACDALISVRSVHVSTNHWVSLCYCVVRPCVMLLHPSEGLYPDGELRARNIWVHWESIVNLEQSKQNDYGDAL